MSIETVARKLELDYFALTPDECRIPPFISSFVGGPRDGEWQRESSQKDRILVARKARSPMVIDSEPPTYPEPLREYGEYRAHSWTDLHHNLPSCQSSHRVTEYRWHE